MQDKYRAARGISRELLNQGEPFHQSHGNFLVVQSLQAVSADFSLVIKYFHSAKSLSRIFLALFAMKTL